MEDLQLNVPLLRRRVPNLTVAAKAAGLRPATVSNLCTGKIPVGRAEVRTLVILASIAGCTLDELIIRGNGRGMIETGIKVLDLLAPIVRGGITGLVARPGTGQMVLLAELLNRLGKRGYTTLFWKPEEEGPGIEEVVEEADGICLSLDEAVHQILHFREEHDVILSADRAIVLSGEWYTLKERIKEEGARPLTIFLVDPRGEAVNVEAPYGPLDTLIRFDMELPTRQLYPAIDPILSTSIILEGAQLESAHLAVQQRARKVLRRYRELRPMLQIQGAGKLGEADRILYHRGERLEAFLSQPFYTAEPFTQRPGQWCSVHETLEDVKLLLDGKADHLNAEELKNIGRLPL